MHSSTRLSPSVSAAVEADGVHKRYGDLVAIDDLTFSAEPGEILAVLGPNGAGKTTAIRVLTTVLAPTRGRFRRGGHSARSARRWIGVLPESAGYPSGRRGRSSFATTRDSTVTRERVQRLGRGACSHALAAPTLARGRRRGSRFPLRAATRLRPRRTAGVRCGRSAQPEAYPAR